MSIADAEAGANLPSPKPIPTMLAERRIRRPDDDFSTTGYRQHMLTLRTLVSVDCTVHVEASARKHGVPDEDMLHALRLRGRAYATDDPDAMMSIGPSITAGPLEVGVVADGEGTAIIHAMKARKKFLRGWWIK